MRADQIERLKSHQAALTTQVQQLLDTPEAERPTDPKELRAWRRDLKAAQDVLLQIEQLVTAGARHAARDERAVQSAEPARD